MKINLLAKEISCASDYKIIDRNHCATSALGFEQKNKKCKALAFQRKEQTYFLGAALSSYDDSNEDSRAAFP